MKFIMVNWVSILIPFFIGLYRYPRLDKNLKIIYYFVVYGTLNEVVTRVAIYNGVKNTMPGIHLYLIVSFGILGIFYTNVLKGLFRRKITILIAVLFCLYSLSNSIFFQSITEYPTFPQAISKIILISFSVLFFYKIMTEANIERLGQEPLIYINIAVLIYYSGNLFFSLLFNLLLEYSKEFSKLTTYYYVAIVTLFYILIAIAFWKTDKQKKEGSL